MAGIPKNEEERLAAEFDEEADQDDNWEEVPAPVERGRPSLGTQVTIRLDAAVAEQLRQVARDRNVGYTSLLRKWIEERLSSEMTLMDRAEPQITYGGRSVVEKDAVHLSGQGGVRLLLGVA